MQTHATDRRTFGGLAMGLLWSIARSLAVWLVLRNLRDLSMHRQPDAVLSLHREASQTP